MAKSTTTSKQSKKPTSDCHCNETKTPSKSKTTKVVKECNCA